MTRRLTTRQPQQAGARNARWLAGLALLLGLAAACVAGPGAGLPAATAVPEPTATPVASLPASATLTLEPAPAPTLTPTPRPPQLSLPPGGLFTPAEQDTLTARLANPPAEWGITPTMDVQADRSRDFIYLIPINPETNQPVEKIIILAGVDSPTWVIADLAGARTAAEAAHLAVSYIMVDLEGQG